MLAEGHRKAAESIEKGIIKLQPNADPAVARVAIEAAWGASFQWIAYGCATRYQQHQNNHTRLGRFLRNFGETDVANWWERVDALRQGGWYGGEPESEEVQEARVLLKQVRLWAIQLPEADAPGGSTMRETSLAYTIEKRSGVVPQDIPAWLDSETRALVKDKIELLVSHHPDILAVILYGSVARHDERPLDDRDPSDVDLLVVVDGDRSTIQAQKSTLFDTMGQAENRHIHAPREVNVMFATRTLQEWDPEFVANVAREGIVLYQRGAVPALFAA